MINDMVSYPYYNGFAHKQTG